MDADRLRSLERIDIAAMNMSVAQQSRIHSTHAAFAAPLFPIGPDGEARAASGNQSDQIPNLIRLLHQRVVRHGQSAESVRVKEHLPHRFSSVAGPIDPLHMGTEAFDIDVEAHPLGEPGEVQIASGSSPVLDLVFGMKVVEMTEQRPPYRTQEKDLSMGMPSLEPILPLSRSRIEVPLQPLLMRRSKRLPSTIAGVT
ncbi:hypothetical protein HGI30_04940 [Paenibacillus albicereus]|uniref:Uncharacterized protein n=1 Tax=Paenibacillus albicereus TaxID=2726185 RepID=A0A6H2GU72_9BACL|nr:hypothetical protein [Paenibacillus albicereus]QJC50971.1 hypothetical protein HGI30_04940 [Paenibacillus albicereus]